MILGFTRSHPRPPATPVPPGPADRSFALLPVPAALLLLSALLTGCQTIHSVKVDSINNPAKPLGTAYRLEMQDPTGSQADELAVRTRAVVKDALAARGMYEAPPNGRADMVITAEYGVGPGQMKIVYRATDPMAMGGSGRGSARPILVFEKYIKLTAREPAPSDQPEATRRTRRDRGEELWSLTVSVEDDKRDLEPYLAVLASTAVDYIGTNSGAELHVPVDPATAASNLRRRAGPTPP